MQANLCFPDALTEELIGRLGRMPRLQCVITLKPLPASAQPSDSHCRLQLQAVRRVRMTWDDTAKVYLYGCGSQGKSKD